MVCGHKSHLGLPTRFVRAAVRTVLWRAPVFQATIIHLYVEEHHQLINSRGTIHATAAVRDQTRQGDRATVLPGGSSSKSGLRHIGRALWGKRVLPFLCYGRYRGPHLNTPFKVRVKPIGKHVSLYAQSTENTSLLKWQLGSLDFLARGPHT